MCETLRVPLLRRQTLKLGLLGLGAASMGPPARTARADGVSIDVLARWLAGLEPLPGVEPSADWKAHATTEKERWLVTQPRVKAMQAWASRELAPLLPEGHSVFYPFAGPDALHALSLFGGARLTAERLHSHGARRNRRTPARGLDH